MSRDHTLSLRDVHTILGHAHLSTTADVYLLEEEAAVIRRVAQHLADREARQPEPTPAVAVGYDAGDPAVLFGETSR
jgi:integrase